MANKEDFTFEIQPITDNTDGIIPEKENVSDLGKSNTWNIWNRLEWIPLKSQLRLYFLSLFGDQSS